MGLVSNSQSPFCLLCSLKNRGSFMNLSVKCHPTLGILVGTDGHVMVPGDKYHKAHWTYGTRHNNGYMTITYKGTEYLVHRLVLETFVGPCPEGYECDHWNRDRSDNRLVNLHWVSKSENQRNTCKNDRCKERLGVNYFDDPKEANRRDCALWYANNKDNPEFKAIRNLRDAEWRKQRKLTHRRVACSDRVRWVPNAEAEELLKLPKSARIYVHC
jgi:hypothetical protein